MINSGRIQDEGRAFVNALGAIRYTIGDKMAQVAQKSMNFLITICSMMSPNISNSALKGELFSYTEPILSAINDKLGDNLVKVRTLAEDSLMAMAEHSAFGLQPCLNMLYRSANPP